MTARVSNTEFYVALAAMSLAGGALPFVILHRELPRCVTCLRRIYSLRHIRMEREAIHHRCLVPWARNRHETHGCDDLCLMLDGCVWEGVES